MPGPGLLAHVIISKYCDHLPLHRQSEIYAREGVELARPTMAEWVGKMEFLLEPLAQAVERHVKHGAILHADERRLQDNGQEPCRGRRTIRKS